jgi:transposase
LIVAEAFAPGASVCAVARRRNVVPGQIYRWQRDLRDVATGFAEVVVAPEPGTKATVGVAAVEIEIEFCGDIRVRIAATTPAALATAIIRALSTR